MKHTMGQIRIRRGRGQVFNLRGPGKLPQAMDFWSKYHKKLDMTKQTFTFTFSTYLPPEKPVWRSRSNS